MKFVDEVTIEVASGHGGPGCVSFRREIFVPRGGPDGGDGGRGGNLIFRSSTRLRSLLDLKLKTKYFAPNGEPGKNQKRSGADGEDLVIYVPPGTMIKTVDGQLIKDLGAEEEFIFLKGGLGGKGNPFYKTSVNQAPSVAQKGMPGQKETIRLELKLLADVGIIGFPNAGKSTLISHISSAKPKIADYPFTTLIPNLGVVRFNSEQNFVVADMPGLIKGAHKGVGLGTRFLKHIERTKCFVHVVDVSGMSNRDPLEDFKDINRELKLYDLQHKGDEDFVPLSTRKQILALNKADTLDEENREKILNKFSKINGLEIILISAATGFQLNKLVMRMGEMVFNGNEKIKTEKNEFQSKKSSKDSKLKNKKDFKTKKSDSDGFKGKDKAKRKSKGEIKAKGKGKGKDGGKDKITAKAKAGHKVQTKGKSGVQVKGKTKTKTGGQTKTGFKAKAKGKN